MPVIPTYDSQATIQPIQQMAKTSQLLTINDAIGPEIRALNDKIVSAERQTAASRSSLEYIKQLDGIKQQGIAEGVTPAQMSDYIYKNASPLIKDYTKQYINPETSLAIEQSLNRNLIAYQADAVQQAAKLESDKRVAGLTDSINELQRISLQNPAMIGENNSQIDQAVAAHLAVGDITPQQANALLAERDKTIALGLAQNSPSRGLAYAEASKNIDPSLLVSIKEKVKADAKRQQAEDFQYEALALQVGNSAYKDVSQIEKDTRYSPNQRRTLVSLFQAGEAKRAEVIQVANLAAQVQDGAAVVVPGSSQAVKVTDFIQSQYFSVAQTAEQQQQAGLNAALATKTLPTNDKNFIVGAITGTPEQSAQAMERLAAYENTLSLVGAGGTAVAGLPKDVQDFYAGYKSKIAAGIPPIQAAKDTNALFQKSSDEIKQIKAKAEDIYNNNFLPRDAIEPFSPIKSLLTLDVPGFLPDSYKNDYKKIAMENIVSFGGDVAAAKEKTNMIIGQIYGKEDATFFGSDKVNTGEITKYPYSKSPIYSSTNVSSEFKKQLDALPPEIVRDKSKISLYSDAITDSIYKKTGIISKVFMVENELGVQVPVQDSKTGQVYRFTPQIDVSNIYNAEVDVASAKNIFDQASIYAGPTPEQVDKAKKSAAMVKKRYEDLQQPLKTKRPPDVPIGN